MCYINEMLTIFMKSCKNCSNKTQDWRSKDRELQHSQIHVQRAKSDGFEVQNELVASRKRSLPLYFWGVKLFTCA